VLRELNGSVLWDVTPCNLVSGYQNFGGSNCVCHSWPENWGSRFL